MDERYVIVGRISGIHGVKGWIKVHSFTEPRENIVTYDPWRLHLANETRKFSVAAGRASGKTIIAQLCGVEDRDSAAGLIGAEILVEREKFSAAKKGEYYWTDLIGLQVQTVNGQDLGVVDHLIETGANDVLVIDGDRRRLVPFLMDIVIKAVDLDDRKIVVEWDPEF